MKLQAYLESLFSSVEVAHAFAWPDTSHCWHFVLFNTIQRVNAGNLLSQHATIGSLTYCKSQFLSYPPTSPKCSVNVWKRSVTDCMYHQGKVFHLKVLNNIGPLNS